LPSKHFQEFVQDVEDKKYTYKEKICLYVECIILTLSVTSKKKDVEAQQKNSV